MPANQRTQIAAAAVLVVGATSLFSAAYGQTAAPTAPVQAGAVVRRVVMKDPLSAEQFRLKLETMKSNGLFRDSLPGVDPKKPVTIEVSFLTSGNYLLVAGSRDWVDANIEAVRLMGFLFERPQAHLQLSLRVVQITGPANADVIQMSETVRALVDAQREEVVRAFSELEAYLQERMRQRSGAEKEVFEAVTALLPSLGTGARPLTVPETLLMLMLDRSSPAPSGALSTDPEQMDAQEALLRLPRLLTRIIRDPDSREEGASREIAPEMAAWKKAVTAARDWCSHSAGDLKKSRDAGVSALRESLLQPGLPLPSWLARRLERSMELTERLYPNLVKRHTEESLRELERRFNVALERAAAIEQSLTKQAAEPAGEDAEAFTPEGRIGRGLIALKALAEELVPAPLALFESVSLTADNAAPSPRQLIEMVREYSAERRRLDVYLADERASLAKVNYAKLQTLEAGLNLWLRRVSDAMARALEQQFYSRYVNQLRLLANKELGKGSSRDILRQSSIGTVPDVARDLLLADTGVNIFVTNSISLQFASGTTNSVSANVQSALPSKQGILERVQQAQQATSALNALNSAFGINGESIVKALLAGGQAVPVQSGITLSASPSVGFDASTVTLSLTANQTLQPNSDKVADRVTNHNINNATVTALSYEPMVLSTLASNISYFESSGGVPFLRKTPVVKNLLREIPLAPFKEGKRQKGIYQSSVIILEPVVIPTIEDLVRFHGGWREAISVGMAAADDEEPPAAPSGPEQAPPR